MTTLIQKIKIKSNTLAVGDEFPIILPPPLLNIGMSANFLTNNINLLLAFIPDITDDEMTGFLKAPRVGLIVHMPVILFLFDFGKGGMYDCAFDSYKPEKLDLPHWQDVNDESRLTVDFCLVEAKTKIIKALRLFTLHPEITNKFFEAVREQQHIDFSTREFDRVLNKYYMAPTHLLIQETIMYPSGT